MDYDDRLKPFVDCAVEDLMNDDAFHEVCMDIFAEMQNVAKENFDLFDDDPNWQVMFVQQTTILAQHVLARAAAQMSYFGPTKQGE